MADEPVNPTDNPDFRAIGKEFHLAADDLGVALKNAGIWERSAVNVAGYLLSYFGKKIGNILDWVGFGIEQFEDKASIIFSPLMARLVGHALGADVSTEAIHERMDRAGTSAIGNLTAQTVFDILQGPEGGLEPGDGGAKRMIGALGHMTVNNWSEGLILEWLAEYLGWHVDLESLPKLAEQLIGNMGLNRLARTALRPLASIVVATPLKWKLNKQYRPTMLSVAEAIRAMHAGTLDEATMREIATRDGWGDDAIAIMIEAERKRFSAADLDLLVRMELKDRSWAIEQLRATGLDDQEAHDRLVLEDAKALRAFQLAVAGRAIAAYAEHRIDAQMLSDEIDHLGLDQTTLDRLHADAVHRRTIAVLHLTRGDVETAIENDVLAFSDYGPWLEARGYAHDDAITLELSLLAKLKKLEDAKHQRELAAAQRQADRAAKLQAQQQTRDRVAAEHAHWTGTLGEAERLVVRTVMPPSQYRMVLVDHGLSAGDADALTAVAIADRDDRTAAAKKRLEAATKNKTPLASLAVLEHAVMLGARSIATFRAELEERKYPADDVQLLVDVLTRELADRAALQAKRDALAGGATGRTIGLGQVEAAVLAGDATIDQYRVRLVNAKYSDADVQLLVALLTSKLKEKAFALERHKLAEQRLEASHVSLANEEKAVVDGILTLDDYTAWLVSHDFDDSDVAVMTALLEEKLAKKAGA